MHHYGLCTFNVTISPDPVHDSLAVRLAHASRRGGPGFSVRYFPQFLHALAHGGTFVTHEETDVPVEEMGGESSTTVCIPFTITDLHRLASENPAAGTRFFQLKVETLFAEVFGRPLSFTTTRTSISRCIKQWIPAAKKYYCRTTWNAGGKKEGGWCSTWRPLSGIGKRVPPAYVSFFFASFRIFFPVSSPHLVFQPYT